MCGIGTRVPIAQCSTPPQPTLLVLVAMGPAARCVCHAVIYALRCFSTLLPLLEMPTPLLSSLGDNITHVINRNTVAARCWIGPTT